MSRKSSLPAEAVMDDLTGLDRLVRNVFTSWAAYFIIMIAGFVMPRIIDRQIGQESLGIWDFCWTIVSYFGFAGIGVGSSVNRYVARYRAINDLEIMNRALSSVNYVQTMIALAMFVVTGLISWSLPILFSKRLGSATGTAAYVLGFLGASLAVRMAFDTYRGVITGCHRWDLHSIINSSSHVLTVVGMLIVLSLGGGLIGMSMFYFFGVVLTEITRFWVAKRVCPELEIKFALASRTQAFEMITFGGKTFLTEISPMLLLQTISVLIATHMGPATLALFARPSALVRSTQAFLNKFAFVLSPTTGSLQGHGRYDELRDLFLQSTRFGVVIALPMVIILSVFGDEILRIWMGPRYEQGAILLILAIGYFLPISQQSAYTMMVGLNRHGRMGLVIFGIALCGIGIAAGIATYSTWNLTWAASIVAVCLTLGHGIAFPIYACRRLGVGITHYLNNTLIGPFVCALPFLGCLILAKETLSYHPLYSLLLSVLGVASIIFLDWRYILPNGARRRIKESIASLFTRSASV